MGEIPVDRSSDAADRAPGTVEVEREITKRRLIEAVTSVLLVVLYMAYTMLRDRDPGVVALDGSNDWS
jgi:hypothetical protein